MTWQLDADGSYVLLAAGVDAKGNPCEEKPQRLCPDGVATGAAYVVRMLKRPTATPQR